MQHVSTDVLSSAAETAAAQRRADEERRRTQLDQLSREASGLSMGGNDGLQQTKMSEGDDGYVDASPADAVGDALSPHKVRGLPSTCCSRCCQRDVRAPYLADV